MILDRTGGETQELQFKIDPGSKQSGLALVSRFQSGWTAIWCGIIEHRGWMVKKRLEKAETPGKVEDIETPRTENSLS